MDIERIEAFGFFCTPDVREGLGTTWMASVHFERVRAGKAQIGTAPYSRWMLDRSFATRPEAVDAIRLFAIDSARRGVGGMLDAGAKPT